MRTTIRIDDDLLAAVKRLAAETDRSMTAVIEDALREMLARRRELSERPPIDLPVFHGSGLMPGVNLDSNADLLDLMEDFEFPDEA